IAMALGNADRAVTEYQRIAEGPASTSLARAKLVEALVMANYMSAAETAAAKLTFDVPLSYTAAIGYALSQADFDTAYQRLEEGLAAFPDDPRLVTIDAERLWADVQSDAARDRLAPVLAIEPSVWQAHMLAGRIALAQRDSEQASASFARVLKVQPNNQTAMLAMAAIANDTGNAVEAANWINKANQAGSPHPVGLLFAAQMAYDAGEIDRAFELIEQVPPGIASSPSFARLRGFVDAARGQYGAAILPLQGYLEDASDDYLARRILAEAYAETGEVENAWATIRPILDDPQADSGALVLALSLAQETGSAEVPRIEALLQKLQSAPKLDAAMIEAGDAIRAGDWAKADAVYAPLLDGAGREDAVLLNNAAAVKTKLGEYSAAVALARRALIQAPESPQILDTLGWALWQEGANRAEARDLITQALERAPGNREIAEHYAIVSRAN
ncbi:MAG: tetratricopeptide repeat protein, partial [Pseudomonadota bacterium]